jgi:hypothetical protein
MKEMVNIWGYQREGRSTCVGDNAAHCNSFLRCVSETRNNTERDIFSSRLFQLGIGTSGEKSQLLSIFLYNLSVGGLYGAARIENALFKNVMSLHIELASVNGC